MRLINEKRALHSAPPLVLNDTISAYSRNWADKQAKESEAGKFFVHSMGKYGENGYPFLSVPFPKSVLSGWYEEIKDYRVSDDKGPGGHARIARILNQNPAS